jgi:hypothetical protein
VKLILLTSLFLCFHSLSRASTLTASLVQKQNNQLVMISEFHAEGWNGLNQVPFNSLKNLLIKGTFLAGDRAILVFDLHESATPQEAIATIETHVMTSQEKLVPAEMNAEANLIKVVLTESGDVMSKATFLGKISDMRSELVGIPLLMTASGQIITENHTAVGQVIVDGNVLTLVVNLEDKIATLTGSGSEIVITGEKKEFLASMDQLKDLNAQQNQNPEWQPVADLKISNLGSVLQVEFRNSSEDESFSLFKLVSPLVVNQIKENQAH